MIHETPAQKRKIGKVMGEFKRGALRSGPGGPKVASRRQAIAIALSEAKVSRRRGPRAVKR
jgi:hypothetical protein